MRCVNLEKVKAHFDITGRPLRVGTRSSMKLTVFRRCLIFGTFLGCCLSGALLAGALGTPRWAHALAARANSTGSRGRVTFGLFSGSRELNVGYGWRTQPFSVPMMVQSEPELLHPAAWIGTVACTGAGLALAALGALFAAVNTATVPASKLAAVPGLYLWNALAVFADLGAILLWVVEYYTKIQYNVLSKVDLNNKWTSEGMADFGRSFWFVVGAAIISALNIVSIIIAMADDREKDPIAPMIEEKSNGAIMLY